MYSRIQEAVHLSLSSRSLEDQTVRKTRELEFQDLSRSNYESRERRNDYYPMPAPINSWFLLRS